MNIGVVFASTGGNKIVRALRSFRLSEPDLPVHIVLDISSNTWKENSTPPLDWFEQQPNVKLRCVSNFAYINGCLNQAMKWLAELGYDYGCLFHDDVIFSPLSEHRGHISEWFEKLSMGHELQQASALSLSYVQIFVPEVWHRPSNEWDSIDLESVILWQKLCPEGRPAGYLGEQLDGKAAYEMHFPKFFVQYHGTQTLRNYTRLGPTGQIIPIASWDAMGGFDEKEGIFYDIQYPAECAVRGWPPVKIIPNIPHLHLHNQTIGFADPATGLWSDTMAAFVKRYGDHSAFWHERGGL